MTQDRRITDRHPDRPLDWSDTETLAGQEWKVLATPHAVAGKGEVPEGWKLVPLKPVPEMLQAAMTAWAITPGTAIEEIYCAMLAASPAAPAIPSPGAAEDERAYELRRDAELAAMLPSVWYMDPPDGGNVPVLEQLRRALDDARRYRYLRNEQTDVGNVIDKEFKPGYWEYRSGAELDAAIDAAMGAAPLATPADAETAQALTDERIDEIAREKWVLDGRDTEDFAYIPFARAIEREVLARLSTPGAPVTASDALLAECRAVFDLMLEGCNEQKFGDFQNGHGEEIGPRMDALHAKLRGQSPAPVTAEPAQQIKSTDEARKFVDEWHKKHFPTDRTFTNYIMGRDKHCALAGDFAWQLANALNSMAAAPAPADRDAIRDEAQQWISVDEREPEDSQTVAILYWPYNNRENSQVAGVAEYVDGAFYTHEGDMHHYPSHWASIPALPIQSIAANEQGMERAADAAETRDAKGGA